MGKGEEWKNSLWPVNSGLGLWRKRTESAKVVIWGVMRLVSTRFSLAMWSFQEMPLQRVSLSMKRRGWSILLESNHMEL